MQQDAQLSQRDCSAGCVIAFAKVEDWNWVTIFYGHYRSICLSRTVSELSQLIVQILDIAFLSTLRGLRDNVRCSSWAHWKARSGLPIGVN